MADVGFQLDGRAVSVPDDGASLLEVLRDRLGERTAKDGCSPQGQCGCCTVLVDGQPASPASLPWPVSVGGGSPPSAGLDESVRDRWATAMCATGGSQCGFCTPGIIVRLAGLSALNDQAGPNDQSRPNDQSGLNDQAAQTGEPVVSGRAILDHAAVDRALGAHLCRCTGWQTIHEAAASIRGAAPWRPVVISRRRHGGGLEGRTPQAVGPFVALGGGGFADDGAPAEALVAVPAADGSWAVGATVGEARSAAGTVPGRRTTAPLSWPLALPDGDWVRTLRTTWVEPAYLEPDASWCVPGGEPVTALGNGGAFGGKLDTGVGAAARALADRHGRSSPRACWRVRMSSASDRSAHRSPQASAPTARGSSASCVRQASRRPWWPHRPCGTCGTCTTGAGVTPRPRGRGSRRCRATDLGRVAGEWMGRGHGAARVVGRRGSGRRALP